MIADVLLENSRPRQHRLESLCYMMLLTFPLCAQVPTGDAALAAQAAKFRVFMQSLPRLPVQVSELPVHPATLEMVSSTAVDSRGEIYLLQRGSKADPVIVVDRQGRLLRSWGKGLYKIPHSIRIDPAGNVWTTDAASSMV